MCFKQRKYPAIIVGIMSGLVAIVGLLMVFLSIRFADAEVFNLGDQEKESSNEGQNEISDFKNKAFIVLLVTSVMAVIIGICGLSLMCVQHRGCAVLFGFSLLPAWAILFIFGIVTAVFSNSSKSTIERFCDNVDMQSEYIQNARDFVGGVDEELGKLVTNKMCSDICPCPDTEAKQSWYSIDEAVLNTYGRTS